MQNLKTFPHSKITSLVLLTEVCKLSNFIYAICLFLLKFMFT